MLCYVACVHAIQLRQLQDMAENKEHCSRSPQVDVGGHGRTLLPSGSSLLPKYELQQS
jgi:hypothetical protein